ICVSQPFDPCAPDAEYAGFTVGYDPSHFGEPLNRFGVAQRQLNLDEDALKHLQFLSHQKLKAPLRDIDEGDLNARCERLFSTNQRGRSPGAAARKSTILERSRDCSVSGSRLRRHGQKLLSADRYLWVWAGERIGRSKIVRPRPMPCRAIMRLTQMEHTKPVL